MTRTSTGRRASGPAAPRHRLVLAGPPGRPARFCPVGRCDARRDTGAATAELAVGLPALVMMTVMGMTAVTAVLTQLQCVDAAREAARSAARGEPGVVAGQRVAPAGAALTVSTDGDTVRATVRVRVRPLGRGLPGFGVSATAIAAVEPGVAEAPP